MAKLKDLFKKSNYITLTPEGGESNHEGNTREESPSVPEGMWVKCPKCGDLIYKEDVVNHYYMCPKCEGYFRIKAKTRVRMVVDPHSFQEWYTDLDTTNPLEFPGYTEKIQQLREKTHLHEAVRIGEAAIDGNPVVIGVCDARFLMGSMGYVVGEKITRSIEEATKRRLPVILFCCSGGARMQEGMVSLMQMAKTAAAVKRHSKAGLLYLPILTDPTTGGVTASFAMLGDIILAEPGALIGFAGPRVIQQTIGQKLPEGFQRAEFLVEHGIIDGIITRDKLKMTLSALIKIHQKTESYSQFQRIVFSYTKKEEENRKKSKKNSKSTQDITAWERVMIARSQERPTCQDYIRTIFDEFMELHGDRALRDDGAVIGGIALLEGQPVTVIGVQKGKSTKENIIRNFGMPSPEGYRKALRLMKQAEKFNRPIITFVDTPGAYCGLEAEERGQGEAIARNLFEMSDLKVPILSVMIGEGGSGGALALAVGNEVWMMENATYSVLSPEGCAAILWKDGSRAPEAAETMKITASDLLRLKIIEKIIPEFNPACPENLDEIAQNMKLQMKAFLLEMDNKSQDELISERYDRFRRM